MCLWDIESAKCEQRQNVCRNLVRITGYTLSHGPIIVSNTLDFLSCVPLYVRIKSISLSIGGLRLSSCPPGIKLFHCPFFSVQVTHVCWVPGSSSIVQTSEDKTIRYRRICNCNYTVSTTVNLQQSNKKKSLEIHFVCSW